MISQEAVLIISIMAVGFVLLLFVLGVIAHRLRESIDSYNGLRAEVKDMAGVIEHTQQARMAAARRSEHQPGVDAHGRTVRRDTPDLPATGRVHKAMKFERAGGDEGGR